MRLNFPAFTAFAKAQAFGLALGFALALWTVNRLDLGLRLFLLATAAAWLLWEFTLGPRAPSHKSDAGSLAYAGLAGFAFPWIGFACTFLLDRLQP